MSLGFRPVAPTSIREGLPRLHVVTDDEVLADPGFPRLADRVLTAGGRDVALHLRGPRTSGRRLFLLVDRVRPVVRREGSLLLVNDRVDLALTAGVHGVHLGRRSLPPHPARELLGADPWVGLSVHAEEDVGTGEEADVDYLVVGTIFATPSHPDRPGSGPELLAAIRERTSLPFLAIGGVTPERVQEVLGTGARGVAVLRGVWEDPDPGRAVERYLAALEGPASEPGVESTRRQA